MNHKPMMLRKASTTIPGKIYYFHYHPASYFDAYIEMADGSFQPVEAKAAAIDCGVPDRRGPDGPVTHWYGNVLFGFREAA
jgi:hypothetical protein